jgi:hypothetical protein
MLQGSAGIEWAPARWAQPPSLATTMARPARCRDMKLRARRRWRRSPRVGGVGDARATGTEIRWRGSHLRNRLSTFPLWKVTLEPRPSGALFR